MLMTPEQKIVLTEYSAPFNPTKSSKIGAFTVKVRTLDYTRCEDGAIDPVNNQCICFEGGIGCVNREEHHGGGESGEQSGQGGGQSGEQSGEQSGGQSGGQSGEQSGGQSGGQIGSGEGNSNSPAAASNGGGGEEVKSKETEDTMTTNKIVAIALAGATGLFLVTAIVFVILFACS